MNVLRASDITEAMEVFSEKCKKLDNMREPFVNTMLKPLLQRIIEQETALETALEGRRNPVEIVYSDHTDYGSTGTKNYVDYTVTQNIGKKECCVQDGRCTFDE